MMNEDSPVYCTYFGEPGMKIEQIAIFLQNEPGRLAEISSSLAEDGINIQALSLSDIDRYGVLRMIVNDTARAKKILKERGFDVGVQNVVILETSDRPGGLARVLSKIRDLRLNIEYLYAFPQRSGESGLLIFRFTNMDDAVLKLSKAGVRLLSLEEVYALLG